MKYLVFLIPIFYFLAVMLWGEIRVYRRGGDVYNWTKSLVDWIDRK